jgi:hypothetical protein
MKKRKEEGVALILSLSSKTKRRSQKSAKGKTKNQLANERPKENMQKAKIEK